MAVLDACAKAPEAQPACGAPDSCRRVPERNLETQCSDVTMTNVGSRQHRVSDSANREQLASKTPPRAIVSFTQSRIGT
jgi:hypothetical protein